MDIFVWFLQKNASVLAVAQSANSQVFIAYIFLCVFIKRSVFLLAFFISCALFEFSIFDFLAEYQLYMITFIIYSYVFYECKNKISKIGCSGVILLSIALAHDARYYGVGGVYGEYQTVLYDNIESITLAAHIFFICSLIPYRRLRDNLRRISVFVVYMSRNSVAMQFI